MPSPFRSSAPVGLLVFAAIGCATAPQNPSFNLAATDARKELREMRQSPRALQRPVVIVHGLGPPVGSWAIEHELRRVTGDDRTLTVSYDYLGSFEHARRQVVEQVEERFPGDDAAETREVDVVAISMGGLVARYAAAPPEGSPGKRLRVARLFTISTPHRGAVMAALPAVLGQTQLDLRERSPFLEELVERETKAPHYEVVPYARLGDRIVGERNAAPEGMTPLWVPNLLLEGSHLLAFTDPRIVGDIARRLRGEAPFATEPAEPLPKG